MDHQIASWFLTKYMKEKLFLNPAAVITVIAFLAAGCVTHEYSRYQNRPMVAVASAPPPGVVYVNGGPPVSLVDPVTVMPGPGYVWIEGAWFWEGRWVWHRGYWMRPPRAGAAWIRPY
jgi:WXXGXW repeat (2 copies)